MSEPGMNAHGLRADPSPFSHPAYTYNRNDVGATYPDLRQPRRGLSGIALMLTIFLVGALVGLSVNWWMKKTAASPGRGNPAAVVRVPAPQPEPSAPLTGARKGISASELPYDGNPPPMDQPEETATERPNSGMAVGARAKTATAEATASSGASGGGTTGHGASGVEREDRPAMAAKEKDAAWPAETSVPEPSSAQVREPDKKKADAKAVAKAQEAEKNAVSEAEIVTRKSRAAPLPQRAARDPEIERIRRQATNDSPEPQQAAKDREIERIRQQAAEELKKKTENERITNESRTSTNNRANPRPAPEKRQTVVAGLSKRAALAQCERRSNFILREHCKWEICDGMWGKNGCPSYERQASSH